MLLGPASAGVHRLSLARALELNPLARALAGSTDLAQAEAASTAVCGFSEIARERARALAPEPPVTVPAVVGSLSERYTDWAARTAARGIEYVTTRRITEELGLTPADSRLLRVELRVAGRHVPPLWRI
ncbi:hypothetical protein [Kitasatospora sp. P5_F3]